MTERASISFLKAHACGNDFLVIDEKFAGTERARIARALCNRNTGVGADGIEWLDLSGKVPCAVLSNSDGSIAEISGNGTRCVAICLAAETGAQHITIDTAAGRKQCRILSADGRCFEVETSMGQPQVNAITVAGRQGVHVSMGNPHFVIFVEKFAQDWVELGAELSIHAEFPDGANVEFVRIVDAASIEFRIYERGAGPTLSSGTGSCASAIAAMATRDMPSELRVIAPGGEQKVRWQEQVFLTGPACLIARGEAYL